MEETAAKTRLSEGGMVKESSSRSLLHQERPPSPVPSCVSMKSDQSNHPPLNFQGGDVTDGSMSGGAKRSLLHQERPPSPVPSCVSMKSDQSNHPPLNFQSGDVTDGSMSGGAKRSLLHQERPPSPVPSCVSMKSDQSNHPPLNFQSGDVTDGSMSGGAKRGQMQDSKPDAVREPFTKSQQEDLKHIFQMFEENIITSVKNELKIFKRMLSPDYQENFESKEEDEGEAREAALKMDFLRKMELGDLADKLQENELDVVCKAELKRNLKNKYQSVFEGIPKQGSSALLEKIYTEVYITEGGSGKINEEHEVRQIESRSKRPAGQETSIKCSDIFKPLPGQDKPIRSVVTKGVAGIGKTVSVQKFILDWAEGKENQDIHFIFPLLFRELNLMREKQLSLMDLLHHFFTEIKQSTFPSQGKFKVLFICDGLDECRLQLDFQKNESLTDVRKVTSLDILLTNIITGNLLPSALLWMTSRPAAANKIPPECVDRVTEVQGFNDPQKEEYFRKRISDQNLASRIVSHIKSSRSLHIMCHIPVFCWIAATVLSVILGSSGGGQIPKTLTEMFTHFFIFQTKQSNLKFENVHDLDPQWNQEVILGLGKLAHKQLKKGNLIFYEEDLKASGIDVREAAVCSGICSQIIREGSGFYQEKVFCFVHLSVQEYHAALFLRLRLIMKQDPCFQCLHKYMITLHKNAVDKALEHEDGRFDLFLRFLLGLSLESNQTLLHGLLQRGQNQMGNEETISYIKEKIREVPSSERVINLFHCLNELNDHSIEEEIQSWLRTVIHFEAQLSPAQWSALVFVLLTSEQKLDEFDLKKYIRSDECLLRLQPVVEESQTAQLNSCGLTERSCTALACILSKPSSKLKNVDLSDNSMGDIGVQELSSGLVNPNCVLVTLSLSNCSITEEGFSSLASALSSNPSYIRELQLGGNKAGDSGVKHLSSLLKDPNCKLEKLE
ncbi:NLR family CARD domain-containing protein 3-like [Clupea harengus]|uniref:NLR family CARD domain-containing protein 3-like n=1 Tax=Clupea harengus TaxID=7950 RepID=A0A6P8G7H3_CLUHA|nr:NLR family CARD domain-containing protein 3-like [Clupea harengus]